MLFGFGVANRFIVSIIGCSIGSFAQRPPSPALQQQQHRCCSSSSVWLIYCYCFLPIRCRFYFLNCSFFISIFCLWFTLPIRCVYFLYYSSNVFFLFFVFDFVAHPHIHAFGLITEVNAYSLRSVGNRKPRRARQRWLQQLRKYGARIGLFRLICFECRCLCWLDLWLCSKEKK